MLLKVKETYHYPKKYIHVFLQNETQHLSPLFRFVQIIYKRYSGVNLDVCGSHAEVLRHEITHRERRIGASDEMAMTSEGCFFLGNPANSPVEVEFFIFGRGGGPGF